MDIKEIYNNLTNVNIDNQKELWDARGKGYYGEYLVFCELYKQISGNCKILMNLDIPTRNGKTTEVDLLLIHETGIYVFEIKHYQGTIYGKDTDNTWTQYFNLSIR
ncbi:MAG: NERD domain-containing protein [Clostridiales bacterium]|nr:NERD domain-containing protein [Clostridiales bacterium]